MTPLEKLTQIDERLSHRRQELVGSARGSVDAVLRLDELLTLAETRARVCRATLESNGMPSWLTALHEAEVREMHRTLVGGE